ncbi:hypothetical protein [Trichoplusia ni ascovirus 2c]|uniref:hypothetical protein n=1 Tax=Trichoplusia ni ascovirus 2c TaxID=328615 RepID=UPI0000E441E9|nr:hypothetical protein TNAV2c_gp017 [Trichoplusia ni ascovirus 2c]ABF70534.1 hypothetical protein [Trichoplusia ni ascovirus 2c]
MNELVYKDVLEMHDTFRGVMNETKHRYLSSEDIDMNVREKLLFDALSYTSIKGKLSTAIKKDISLIQRLRNTTANEILYSYNNRRIISEYMNLLSKPISRGGRKQLEIQRKRLTREYVDSLNVLLDMSKHYTKFLKCNNHAYLGGGNSKSNNTNTSNYKCDECGNVDKFNKDVDSITCDVCGCELTLLVETFRTSSVRNSTCNSVYNRTMHFRDCLYQYQGMHTPILSNDVYVSLVKAMRECNVMGNTGVKEVDGANVTKGVVLYFLKQLNFTRHYDDAVYIHHALTGQEPDNVQHLEAQLIHDFSILSKKYDELYAGKKERRSFINMQIVLYQLLKRYNHPCKLDDFASIKSLEQRARRDELYKDLFNALGWKYEDI